MDESNKHEGKLIQIGYNTKEYIQASLFTLGCYYRAQGTGFMSMYGSVTDAQIFSRELSDQEMIDVTTCSAFLNGDILSWDREPWTLKSPWQSSEEEMLDLEKDVCKSPENGLFMVPHKMSNEESLHFCKKLSGSLVTYRNKTDFDDITYFLSLQNNMNSVGCKYRGTTYLRVWAGGTDVMQEGLWKTWNTREHIEVGSLEKLLQIIKIYYF